MIAYQNSLAAATQLGDAYSNKHLTAEEESALKSIPSSYHFERPETGEQIKVGRSGEGGKVLKVEFYEANNRKTIGKVDEARSWFFQKVDGTVKLQQD